MTNEAARRISGVFQEPSALSPEHARNAMHVICHPQGMRRFIVNWEELAGPLIQTLHREAAHGTNPADTATEEAARRLAVAASVDGRA